MAQTQQQAKLGLLISAKDEASKIFEEFARNVAADMERVQRSIMEGLKMDGVTRTVQEDATKIQESFKNIYESTRELSNANFGERVQTELKDMASQSNNAAETIREDSTSIGESFRSIYESSRELTNINVGERVDGQLREMATQANATAETMNRDFSSIATHASTMAERITTATHAFHFGDMMDAGMQLQQTGEHMLGFFESAVEAGAEFDQSIKNATSSLNANLEKTKLSKAQIEAMGNAALQMGSDGFFSANQIAEAMNTMAKQGLTYQDIMSGGIQVVKNVAAANQQDLEETANVVSDIYNEMGEEFKKAGKTSQEASQEIGNSMTVALHHARISMGDFLQTMKYVGPQASAVGVSIQDVSAAIAVLGQHGIRGSQAGTTLRRMLTNLTPASKEAGAMMRQLGMITKDGGNVFYDAHGKMKSFTDVQKILHDKLGGLTPQMQQFAIKTIFGQYALSGMTAIVNTSNDKFQTLTREMGNNNIMTDIMNTKSQGLAMQIQKLKAHFETLQKEIGLMLRPVLAVIIVLAEKLMNAWEHLSHPVKQAIVIFGAIASVLLVVGGTVLTMLGLFGMFITSAGAAVAGISRLLGVLRLMSPPVLAVIAVIAALKYAWDHDIGGIREITSKFLNWFKPIFGHTFNQAKKDVMDALHTITKGFTGWNKDVMGPINKTVNSILHAFVDGLKTVVKAVSTGITTVTGWFKKMAPDINKAMHNIVAFFTKHSAVWNALWVAFKFVVKFAWDFIIGIIKHAWGLFSGIIQLFVHIINGQWKKVFQDLWQIVKNAFLLALDLMGGFVGKAFGWFGRFLAHTNIFGKSFSKILSWAFTHMGQIADKAWKYVEKIFNGAIKVIESLVRPLSKFIQAMFKGIAKFISEHSGAAMNFLKKAFQVGLNVAKTLLKGLWTEVKDILMAIKSLFSGEPGKAMKFLMDAFKTGFNTVKSLMDKWFSGVKTVFTTVKSFIQTHATQAMTNMKNAFNTGVNFVKSLLSKWGSSVKSVFNTIKSNIEGPIKAALSFLKKTFQSEINIAKTAINGFKSVVSSVFSAIKSLISGHSGAAMTALKNAFKTGISTARGVLSGIGGMIDGILGGLPSKMLKWGTNAMNMFVSGIKSGIGKIAGAVSGAAAKIKDILGFHSPTKEGPAAKGESDQWMPNMMKMLAKGIHDNKHKIQQATMGVALGIQQTFSGTQEHVYNAAGATSPKATAVMNNHKNNRQVVVNINIEGRSAKSDKELAENIAKQFRTQMSMVLR